MPRLRTLLFVSLFVVAFMASWTPPVARADHPQYLTVAAANSLKEALRAVLPIFEKDRGNVEVRVVWGPSQSLRDKIEQGAPIDVFLPSSLEEIESLEKKGLILQGTKQVYAETALVLIAQAAVPVTVSSLKDLAGSQVRRIAIGDPKTSSVGKFAAQVLKNTALDGKLRSRYVYGEHSGAVLELVASGEAEVGLVYRTDAIHNKKVRVVAEIAPDTHHPILYGLATVWTAKNPFLAQQFKEFILSAKIQDILKTHGFERANAQIALR